MMTSLRHHHSSYIGRKGTDREYHPTYEPTGNIIRCMDNGEHHQKYEPTGIIIRRMNQRGTSSNIWAKGEHHQMYEPTGNIIRRMNQRGTSSDVWTKNVRHSVVVVTQILKAFYSPPLCLGNIKSYLWSCCSWTMPKFFHRIQPSV